MSVILNSHKIFYGAAPKVACTSLKSAFFVLENGFKYQAFLSNGRRRHIHNVYPTQLRESYPEKRIADFWRVTFVRDPIRRVLSAYSNRVLHHKELSQQKAGKALEDLGLQAKPDLGMFVDNLEAYQKAHPSMLHHTRPLVDFLGSEPDYFSQIYQLSEMDVFCADISERTGHNFVVGREQTGGPKFKVDELTKAQLEKLKAYYQADYKAFGDYF